MRELIPRQVDKKAEVPAEEKGVRLLKQRKGSRIPQGEGKDKHLFFPLHYLVLVT